MLKDALIMNVKSAYLNHPSFMEEFSVDRWGDLYDKELDIYWLYAGCLHNVHVFVRDPSKI